MRFASLILAIAAAYLPAAAAAHGRGSRRTWIGLALASLCVGAAALMFGQQLTGLVDTVLYTSTEGEPFGRQVTLNLLALIIRLSLAFSLGSFLAAVLCGRRGTDATKPLLHLR